MVINRQYVCGGCTFSLNLTEKRSNWQGIGGGPLIIIIIIMHFILTELHIFQNAKCNNCSSLPVTENVKSTANHLPRPGANDWMAFHLVHKLISCPHWSCAHSCVLEEGLCKEVWRKRQIFSGCVLWNSSALELVSPFLPTLPLKDCL